LGIVKYLYIMKFIINESQYRRLLSENAPVPSNVHSLSQFITNLNTLAKKESPNLPGSNKEMTA
jgi:hypothetical protein